MAPSSSSRAREPGGTGGFLDRVASAVASVRARVEAARARGPRAAREVALVIVTKGVGPAAFPALAACGALDVGENRVLDAAARRAGAPSGLVWHGIGHVQTNKARPAVETFDVLHAVDSDRLARALDRALAGRARPPLPVYVQVNAAADPAKGGPPPQGAAALLDAVLACPRLRPVGFMTMAREGSGEREARACFATLAAVRDDAVARGRGDPPPAGLSMGMSDDFEAAVEEGATVVRVGRAVWGAVGPVPGEIAGAPRGTLGGSRS